MQASLLSEIEAFLADAGIGEHRFGFLACKNGRLVARLREGGEILPRTERKVRDFMRERSEPAA